MTIWYDDARLLRGLNGSDACDGNRVPVGEPAILDECDSGGTGFQNCAGPCCTKRGCLLRYITHGSGSQRRGDGVEQFFDMERLVHDAVCAVLQHGEHDLVLRKACGDEHFHSIGDLPEGFEGSLAVHFRHEHVKDDKVDVRGLFLEDVDGFAPVDRRQDFVTFTGDYFGHQVADDVLVVDNQNRFSR